MCGTRKTVYSSKAALNTGLNMCGMWGTQGPIEAHGLMSVQNIRDVGYIRTHSSNSLNTYLHTGFIKESGCGALIEQ